MRCSLYPFLCNLQPGIPRGYVLLCGSPDNLFCVLSDLFFDELSHILLLSTNIFYIRTNHPPALATKSGTTKIPFLNKRSSTSGDMERLLPETMILAFMLW